MSLFYHFYAIYNKIGPSARPFARLSVRSKKMFFEKVCHLNCIFIWGHLSRTVTQFLFSIFNNVVHSSDLGETPSDSASHQAPNYVQRYKISQNTLKLSGTVTIFFSIYLCSVLYGNL